MAKSKKKYYVVWEGRQTGIFETWKECESQVKGYQGARYKSFTNKALAEEAFGGHSGRFIGQKTSKANLSKVELAKIGTPIWESIAVDAACSGNPGILEYQGVDTTTGQRLFHMGPFPQGTVNLGEFLALVHGLAYLKKRNSNLPIYSDSKTARAWVRDLQVRTTLARSPRNRRLFTLVDQALYWLKNNTYSNPILKWETKAWGEIPADFGRK